MFTRIVLTEAQKDELTRAFRNALDRPNFREWTITPARPIALSENQQFLEYEPSGTFYWLIATGPELIRESMAIGILAADLEGSHGR